MKDFRNLTGFRMLKKKTRSDKALSALVEYVDILEGQVTTLSEIVERIQRRPLVEAKADKRIWFSMVLPISIVADPAIEHYLIEQRHAGSLDYVITEAHVSAGGNIVLQASIDIYCIESIWEEVRNKIMELSKGDAIATRRYNNHILEEQECE